jgi:hypothetical protein
MKKSNTNKRPFLNAFEPDFVLVPIASLLPVKALRPTVKASHKYQKIATSVREIGLVEAPIVVRDLKFPGLFLLLDGHLRVEILKDMPMRFKRLAPKPPVLPTAAWINPPKKEATPTSINPACSLN